MTKAAPDWFFKIELFLIFMKDSPFHFMIRFLNVMAEVNVLGETLV